MTRQGSKKLLSPLPLDRSGIALLYLIVLFTLLGVLISAGYRLLGPTVARRMTNDSKASMERDTQIITAWAVKNGRLPIPAEYPAVFGSAPLDTWGKPVVFAYYSSLTHDNSLCGRASAPVSYNGQDVAFLLLSGGDDLNITSKLKTDAPFNTSGPFTINGTMNSADILPEDLYRIVTLNELNTVAGCATRSQGTFRIVNNELPKGCEGENYKTTFFGDGGVPPVDFSYPGLPAWITRTGVHFENLSSNSAPTPSSYTINVTATDAAANTVKRSYLLKIDACP